MGPLAALAPVVALLALGLGLLLLTFGRAGVPRRAGFLAVTAASMLTAATGAYRGFESDAAWVACILGVAGLLLALGSGGEAENPPAADREHRR